MLSAKVKGGTPDDVTAAQLAELDEAIAEANRGEGIPWETVRAELFRR
jgi:predicted transcriptional regulator